MVPVGKLLSGVNLTAILVRPCAFGWINAPNPIGDSKTFKTWPNTWVSLRGLKNGPSDHSSANLGKQFDDILPSDRSNYYSLFDHEISYDVNLTAIKQKYLNLQRQLHPDKFVSRPESDQQTSLELSTLVNEAFKVLSNPYERGIYLLKLNGIQREESEGNYVMDPDFLEEMLQINEFIQDSQADEGLTKLRSEVESKIGFLMADISQRFRTKSYQDVQVTLNKLKFYVNIMDKIKEKE